ncbi:MAG: hypothetical protein ACU88J_02680 [Gammaproteobacteria bacterium]
MTEDSNTQGTLTGGLGKLHALVKPFKQALMERHLEDISTKPNYNRS